MSIPTFTVVPSTSNPTSFASDMDTWLSEITDWTNAVNDTGGVFGLSVRGTSTTSLTIGTGSKSLTTQTGLNYGPGSPVIIASTASPQNRMICTVTTYDTGTGDLVVNADTVGGSGTFAVWSLVPTAVASWDSQTYTDLRLAGKITETVYVLSGVDINPANGSIQTKTLTVNTTFTESLADGNSVLLMLTTAGYTVTWPTITWIWGYAPTLSATLKNCILLWHVAGVVYGVNIGTA